MIFLNTEFGYYKRYAEQAEANKKSNLTLRI